MKVEEIEVGSDFCGVGAFDQSLMRSGIKYKKIFSCDMDKYSRISYIHNYGTKKDIEILETDDYIFVADIFHRIFVDTDLKQPNKEDEEKAYLMCERVANEFSFYFPWNVYNRSIHKKSLDIYMTSPPCQAFSIAGKRGGENDKRGILFYNSHELIQKNKPRYFIFENVKGLLSDNNGKTFNNWINLLGGKSVNGNQVMFPLAESTPYHIYHNVLNAKHYGIPQNRERVFIIGIRDDVDNVFTWPKRHFLKKKLKDVLEDNVDEKYFLSDDMVSNLIKYNERQKKNDRGFSAKFRDVETTDTMDTIKVGGGGKDDLIKVGFINQDTQASKVISDEGISSTLSSGTHGYAQGYVSVKSNTKKGFEHVKNGESINMTQPDSKTRRGRVGKQIAQTIDTKCQQCVLISHVSRSEEGKRKRKESMKKGVDHTPFQAKKVTFKESDVMNCITTATKKDNLIKTCAVRGRGIDNEQQLEIKEGYTSNSLTTVQKDNLIISHNTGLNETQSRIRRLTPKECFILMGFPDD